jgi:general secretion pathway protein L
MIGLGKVSEGFDSWINTVAVTMTGVADRLTFPNKIELVEEENGAFRLRAQKNAPSSVPIESLQIANGQVVGPVSEKVAAMLRGSRAEIRLRPSRFLFRSLELPGRASEFLDGVVRSQIDRLTPWNASDAVFGFSPPEELASDRITVTVAATARAQVAPYVKALADAGVESITLTTVKEDEAGGSIPIKVLEERPRSIVDVSRVRRALVVVLVLAGLAAVTSITSAAIIGNNLEDKQNELARRLVERRAALRASEGSAPALSALGKLELRKQESPASVMVIEVLSQVLPDHTYVTELRIEGDKLRLTGVTRDAPSLIRLIEQTSHFSRATFFAPTTRTPSDPGDRFHIEAQIGPLFSPPS